MNSESKARARIRILSHLCQFSLGRDIGGRDYAGLSDMRFRSNDNPAVGSLVAIQSASPSKWYLSWVVAVKLGDWPVYTLESIEDGSLCDWSNVGVLEYDRSQTDEHPEWRWTDRQHEFNDRWKRACYKKRDAYMYLPVQAQFDKEGDGVTLMMRSRYGFVPLTPFRHFGNWRKTTIKMMLEFYDEGEKEMKDWKAESA